MARNSREGGKYDIKKLQEAESEWKTAHQLSPQSPDIHLHMCVALCKEMHDAEGKAEFEQCIQMAPQGPYAKFAQSFALHPRLARDEKAPEFAFTSLQGQSIDLQNSIGKFVVLDFWATWCPPCRASVGEMKELVKKLPADRAVIISVSADDDESKWKEFVSQKKMDWQQYRDADQQVRKLFNVHAFPTYILIDPDGFISERIVGENPQQTIIARLKQSLTTSIGAAPLQ